MGLPKKFTLVISNELLPDIQEAINGQINIIAELLITNYPKVDLEKGIHEVLKKYEDPGIVDLCKRIEKLEYIATKLDEYSYSLNEIDG
jgi:hypothetical protein